MEIDDARTPVHETLNVIPDRRQRLSAMLAVVDAQQATLNTQWETYVATAARLPALSPSNVLLVLAQQPIAVHIGSFEYWAHLSRRPVRRGLALLTPALRPRRVNGVVQWDGDRRELEEVRYRPATAFDYADTAGLAFDPHPRAGEVEAIGLLDDLVAACAAFGYAVEPSTHTRVRGRAVLLGPGDVAGRAAALAQVVAEIAGAGDGAELYRHIVCMNAGVVTPIPAVPDEPLAVAERAYRALRRTTMRVSFSGMRRYPLR